MCLQKLFYFLHLRQSLVIWEGHVVNPIPVLICRPVVQRFRPCLYLVVLDSFRVVLFTRNKHTGDKDQPSHLQSHTDNVDAHTCTIVCSPLLLQLRGHKQNDDAGAHRAHDDPEHDEPWSSARVKGRRQGGRDADELQSLIGQQEGAVDPIPGLPIRQQQHLFCTHITLIKHSWTLLP